MGAISSSASLPILKEFLNDSNRSVRETCEIAIAKIEWDNSEEGQKHQQELKSSDNTPCVPLPLTRLVFESLIYRVQNVYLDRPRTSHIRSPLRRTETRNHNPRENRHPSKRPHKYRVAAIRAISCNVRAKKHRYTSRCGCSSFRLFG